MTTRREVPSVGPVLATIEQQHDDARTGQRFDTRPHRVKS